MKRTWILAAALAAAGIAGCADAPYYDNGYAYNGAYYNDPYYAAPYPGYYVDPAPSVEFGLAFSDSDRHWDGHRWRDRDHHWNGERHWDGDRGAASPSAGYAPNDPAWNNGGHASSTDSRG